MNYYLIEEILRPCSAEEIRHASHQFVAVLTSSEWESAKDFFDMGIDIGVETGVPTETKAIVNIDCLTGTVCRPGLSVNGTERQGFSFALDETGIVMIDDSTYVISLVQRIMVTKRWKYPGLERFLYDLLELIIFEDTSMLEVIDHRLSAIEESITADDLDYCPPEMNDIRSDLLDLRIHYEQMIDLGQELEENENGFFQEDKLRYFHLFTERVSRLQTRVTGHRDYAMMLRDLLQSNIDIRMNRIMTVLTVITSIFLPLTLIAGWYGMNFRYMPELEWKFGYPMVIIVSIAIVVLSLLWFKRKKWL